MVCLGNSDDNTEDLIRSINDSRIRIVPSVWDNSLREGGKVLAVETNKAFDAVNPAAEWAIYLQADEVIHEDDYGAIRKGMHQYADNKNVEGLLFNYQHFYGSYSYTGDSRRWYRHEIRIIRNDKSIRSFRDAQGFRKNDRKLKVAAIPARIFHYGWVKNPVQQQEKQKSFHKLWHDDQWVKEKTKSQQYDYSEIDSLSPFNGSHPSVMKKRIAMKDWEFTYHPSDKKLTLKDKILKLAEKTTGYRFFEYKNYIRIR